MAEPSQQELVRRLRVGLGDRFTGLRVLGRGGMGLVLEGEDARLGRQVAVKVLLSHLADDKTLRHRFNREIQAMARVEHPHVVRLYDVGDADGLPFIVMAYVEGTTLRQLMVAEPDDPCWTTQIVGDVADGLAAIHARGVVHRDLKPENIMVDSEGRGILMDFGLVSFADEATMTALTKTGQVVGTLRYLPPELLAGGRSDARADIYQLGVILYESLTGHHPFAVGDLRTLIQAFSARSVKPPAGPGIDETLASLVMRCIEPDPQLRPASAAELRDALRAWTGTRRQVAAQSTATLELPRRSRAASRSAKLPAVAVRGQSTEIFVARAGRRRAIGAMVAVAVLLGGAALVRRQPGAGGVVTVPPVVVADALERDAIGWTPLHRAVFEHDVDLVKLRASGPELNAADDVGWTPLHVAAWMGRPDEARYLRAAGANVDAEDALGRTPLAWAALRRFPGMCRLLIKESHASPLSRDRDGRTPLHLAVLGGRAEVVAEILGRGGDATARDVYGQTPLHLAAAEGHSDFIDVLLASGAGVSDRDYRGRTPLTTAIVLRHPQTALALIDAGADLAVVDFIGSTPLHEAAWRGYPDVVRRLLEAGARRDVRNLRGQTPLQQAQRKANHAVMVLLGGR